MKTIGRQNILTAGLAFTLVDPRAGTVEVDFEVFTDRLAELGVNVSQVRNKIDLGDLAPNLRTQLMGNPVTGEAFLVIEGPATADRTWFHTKSSLHPIDAVNDGTRPGPAACTS